METKQKLVLGVVGILSTLGLGWMVTRIIEPEEGNDELPKISVSMSWE